MKLQNSGGLTPEEHNALMGVASMPARGDFNPTKEKTEYYRIRVGSSTVNTILPISGYNKFYIRTESSGTTITVQLYDITGQAIGTATTVPVNTWGEFDLSSNVSFAYLTSNASSSYPNAWISLLTAESPYNPDNQTP